MAGRRVRRWAALAVGLAVVATACGGSGSTTEEASPATVDAASSSAGSTPAGASGSTVGSAAGSGTTGATTATTATAPGALLPAVDVIDLATGREVSLASLVDAERATLFWAWAPY